MAIAYEDEHGREPTHIVLGEKEMRESMPFALLQIRPPCRPTVGITTLIQEKVVSLTVVRVPVQTAFYVC